MKKVILATLLAFIGLAIVSDASAWGRRGGRCGVRSCERSCEAPRCETPRANCNIPVITETTVQEQPCGAAPCCLTAVQVPAQLYKEVNISYEWKCPTGCTVNPGMEGSYN